MRPLLVSLVQRKTPAACLNAARTSSSMVTGFSLSMVGRTCSSP
jgi:hypothetical protein